MLFSEATFSSLVLTAYIINRLPQVGKPLGRHTKADVRLQKLWYA